MFNENTKEVNEIIARMLAGSTLAIILFMRRWRKLNE